MNDDIVIAGQVENPQTGDPLVDNVPGATVAPAPAEAEEPAVDEEPAEEPAADAEGEA